MSHAVSFRIAALAWALSGLVACSRPGEREIARGNEAARAGRFDEALQAFELAAQADPASARPHALLGNTLFRLGRKPEAVRAWQAALTVDPALPDALLGLSRASTEALDCAAALRRLSLLPRSVAETAEARAVRALALLARGSTGDADQALADALWALERSPGSPETTYLVASAQLALHRLAEAQTTLEALQRQLPASPLGSFGLARLAAAQSRGTDALIHLRAARAAAGSAWNPDAVAADPAFAFLLQDPAFRELNRP